MDAIWLSVTTDAAGAGTVTAGRNVRPDTPRRLYAVEWVDGTFADGVDAVLSVVNTLGGADVTLLTLTDADNDGWYYPRTAACDGTAGVLTHYEQPVINGDLRLVVSNGGSVTLGGAYVYLGD
jgi:hypothetical protein